MRGSCLCGGVAFEVEEPLSEIELCHCRKCQKSYGSAFASSLYLLKECFRWRSGEDQVAIFDAPLEQSPPAYRHSFCRRCGSPLPLVWNALPFVEIPVSALDEAIEVRPAYQMFECQRASWLGETHGLRWYERGAPLEEKVLRPLL